MGKKKSPLESGFWLSAEEKRYILIVCAIFLLGILVRYWYLKRDQPREYTPVGLDLGGKLDE